MTELAIRDNSDVERISELKRSIDRIETLTHAKEATDQATAIDAYARAKKSIELVLQAVELRVWAERRAGQLIRESKADHKELAREHQIGLAVALRWIGWTLVSEEAIETVLAEMRSNKFETSVHGIYRRVQENHVKKVERGIEKFPNGRYRLTWNANGSKHSRVSSYPSLEAARRALLSYRGDTTRVSTTNADLSSAYADLRRALQRCDRAHGEATGENRKQIADAIKALHAAEDVLVIAVKGAA